MNRGIFSLILEHYNHTKFSLEIISISNNRPLKFNELLFFLYIFLKEFLNLIFITSTPITAIILFDNFVVPRMDNID